MTVAAARQSQASEGELRCVSLPLIR
jgi:hypothetical protein